MLKLCCTVCGVIDCYDESLVQYAFDSVHVSCYNCGGKINIDYESVAGQPLLPATLPILPIGTVIAITNKQHPWFEDVGIVRDKKFKHYRIEVHGQLVWMPEDWVQQNEPNDADQ